MIITKITGGIGNQLFQYAVGRKLSLINNSPFKVDISSFTQGGRQYMLDKFNIQADIADSADVAIFEKASIISQLSNIIKPYYKRLIIRERSFRFDPNILKIKPPALVVGYWQSEKYFVDIRDTLVGDLNPITFTNQPKQMAFFKDKILTTTSVAIHVRRGDYVTHPLYKYKFGLCSIDYYRQAMNIISERVPNAHFFVFSDDMDWVKLYFPKVDNVVFVDYQSNIRDFEDFYLMMSCKHFIIANSSYSWWCAWLSKNITKTVIAPKRWFNDTSLNKQTSHLIPNVWLRI